MLFSFVFYSLSHFYHIQKYGIKRLKARIRVSLSIWRVSYSFRANTFFSLYDSRCRVKRLFSYHIFRVIYYNRKPFSKSQALIVVSFSQHLFILYRLSFLFMFNNRFRPQYLPSINSLQRWWTLPMSRTWKSGARGIPEIQTT